MKWELEQARNGQQTLKLNDKYLYNKYNPQQEVTRFMIQEVVDMNKQFILVGLGSGYHLHYLLN